MNEDLLQLQSRGFRLSEGFEELSKLYPPLNSVQKHPTSTVHGWAVRQNTSVPDHPLEERA